MNDETRQNTYRTQNRTTLTTEGPSHHPYTRIMEKGKCAYVAGKRLNPLFSMKVKRYSSVYLILNTSSLKYFKI